MTATDNVQDRIDPTPAQDLDDLARFMKMLRVRADSPTYRDLEKRARTQGLSLPRTTLSDVLAGRRFPSKAFFLTFVQLCGVNPAADRRWESTWNRLAVQYKVDLPSAPSRAPNGRNRLAEMEAQLAEARTTIEEHKRAARGAAAAWQEIESALRRTGQWELAEWALRASVELQSRVLAPDGDTLATARRTPATATEAKAGPVPAQGERVGAGEDPPDSTASGAALDNSEWSSPSQRDPGGPSDGRSAGYLPAVWRMEPRNPDFTGRDAVLTSLRQRLHSGGAAVVQALRGLGGIGKTQIAIEYAHRFSGDYDIVWWIVAEDPTLIREQIAALGVELGLVDPGADTAAATSLVKAHLRSCGRWLLLFDNAEDPASLREWLPGGSGHVILTSRTGGWDHLAAVVSIDIMVRPEAVALLRNHHPELSWDEADRLALALGDLPLALTQAGGFLAETATSVDEYIHLLTHHADVLLSEGQTGDYPRPLAAAIALSTKRLAQLDSIGLAIVRLCAFFAPEAVPVSWLTSAAYRQSSDDDPLLALVEGSGNPVAIRRGIGAISRFGLAIVGRDGVRLHRLVQSLIRYQLSVPEREAVRHHACVVLVSQHPGDPEDPRVWPGWARIVPHLLAVDPAETNDSALRDLVCAAGWYLIERGDSDTSIRLADSLYKRWRSDLGPDSFHTLWAGRCLARARREQGQYDQAKEIYDDTLIRSRQHLGEDHPDTLRLAHGSAINLRMLGQYEQARQLQEDTFHRYRRVLGEDHPHTLHSANHLAVDLNELGQHQQARVLHEETLARYGRVLGADHPDTLRSANNLAVDLRNLGQYEQARQLQEDTLLRRRRVLGDDHPYTLYSANSLSETLYAIGHYEVAWQMQEDTLARYRRVLGNDHPDTLRAARSLAETLHELGHDDRSRAIQEDTLTRFRRILGEKHPETTRSAAHLAKILASLGLHEEARRAGHIATDL